MLIVGITAIMHIFYMIFFMPLPFISSLWEENIHRHRMLRDVEQRIMGLHKEEVILMLGEPNPQQPFQPDSIFLYELRPRGHSHAWNHLIIWFDQNDFVRNTSSGNPLHHGIFH